MSIPIITISRELGSGGYSIGKKTAEQGFLFEHWSRIRTGNVIERPNREIRRRTRFVGCSPDGNYAWMLVCARLAM